MVNEHAATHQAFPQPKRWGSPHSAGQEPGIGVFEYAIDVMPAHFMFWYAASFIGLWLWIGLCGDAGFRVAGILAGILWVILSIIPLLIIPYGLLSIFSASLIGAWMTPQDWLTTSVRAIRRRAASAKARHARSARTTGDWLLPLAIVLLIGTACGDDD